MTGDELREKLLCFLQELDDSTDPTTESEIASSIRILGAVDSEAEVPFEARAEHIAFLFCENCADKDNVWGTYFGPITISKDAAGTVYESPSIKWVDEAAIDYWQNRARQCKNPLLKARYLGLVWDFTRKVTGDAPNHEIGREYVSTLLVIAERGLHKHTVNVRFKLARALSVACSLNDRALISGCKDGILQYEDRVAIDNKPGLWGFSFDLLWRNLKVALTQEEIDGIVNKLEARLERLSGHSADSTPDPWASEHAAERLAKYYRARSRSADVRRVLEKLEAAYDHVANEASPLMACKLLEKMHSIYHKFNLNDHARAISVRLRELGTGVNEDMKELVHTVQISREEMERYVEAMTQGGLDEAVMRIAVNNLPTEAQTREEVIKLSRESPLLYRVRQHITDYRGRLIAEIGSLDDNMEGRVIYQMSQNMKLWAIFLDLVMIDLIDRYGLDAEELTNLIHLSPLFREDKRDIIKAGLQAYLNADYLLAIHILIPQIEDAVRELLQGLGGAVLEPIQGGGFHVKAFDKLLRENKIQEALGPDVTLYFRVLFTDHRGWNLRNNVCHGLLPSQAFVKQIADRVMHALLCLSLIRHEEKKSE